MTPSFCRAVYSRQAGFRPCPSAPLALTDRPCPPAVAPRLPLPRPRGSGHLLIPVSAATDSPSSSCTPRRTGLSKTEIQPSQCRGQAESSARYSAHRALALCCAAHASGPRHRRFLDPKCPSAPPRPTSSGSASPPSLPQPPRVVVSRSHRSRWMTRT